MFEWLASVVYRRRWAVLAMSALLLAAACAVLARGGTLTSGAFTGLEAQRAELLVDAIRGAPAETTLVAVFRSGQRDANDPAFRSAVEAALAPLRGDARVLSVTTPWDAPAPLAPHMLNGRGRAAFALVVLKGDFKEALQAYPAVRRRLRSDALDVACTGQLVFMHDLGVVLERDLLRAEQVSMPLALLVLLLVFRSPIAALLPVGVGGLSVASGIAVVLALSRAVDVSQYTVNVSSLVGLGVAIDYSLFTVSRYREELAAGHAPRTALQRTMGSAGRVVAFSGLAVGTGLAGLLFFRGSFLWMMGLGGSIVVLLSVVFALTFLPALLAVLGPRVDLWRLGRAPRAGAGEGPWRSLARAVMRRPVAVLVPTLAVLVVMGAPFFHLRMAATDVRVLPETSEGRKAHDWLISLFPEEAATRVDVAVVFPTTPALTRARIAALFDLSRRIARIPGVQKVESLVDRERTDDAEPEDPVAAKEDYEEILLDPPPMDAALVADGKKLMVGDRTVLLHAITAAAPESREAREIVRRIRADRAAGDGLLVVGGQPAVDLDESEYIASRTPPALAFVVTVTLIVIFLLLRSVVLPLKAVVMNFLSIAGSFGALVWVFEDGHLWVDVGRPLEPSLPMLLFCVLFGLSMDYEVLMLSRMREAFLAGADNVAAVAEGLGQTAGLITSAAAIMIAVFSAFALANVVVMQAVGFGMALAVALDATVVRVLLVPATMRLFGRANWWPG